MAGFASDSPLGRQLATVNEYSPQLLFPIARAATRASLNLPVTLPFLGVDQWTAYELSWLDEQGKPQVAIAEFDFPCDSPNLIESKSFKLYLNSLNFTRQRSSAELGMLMQRDLAAAAGAPPVIRIYALSEYRAVHQSYPAAVQLDQLAIKIEEYQRCPSLLRLADGEEREETLCSNLFRSCCPVTGQPDWASVAVTYRGKALDHASVLAYLVSYRNHSGFHEQCVEQIYIDLMAFSAPRQLSVSARFLRRGGLDINPWRSSGEDAASGGRTVRQ